MWFSFSLRGSQWPFIGILFTHIISDHRGPQRNNRGPQRNTKLCGSPFHSAALSGLLLAFFLHILFQTTEDRREILEDQRKIQYQTFTREINLFNPSVKRNTLKFISSPIVELDSFKYVNTWAMCTSVRTSTDFISTTTLFSTSKSNL